MNIYNERAGIEGIARFFDTPGHPTFPATAHWRLDCETTRKTLQDWTALTIQSSVGATGLTKEVYAEISIAGGLNAIQNDANPRELKKVLIVANKDTDREFSFEWPYYVKNLRGRK